MTRRVAVLGGGQLGRMLGVAGIPLDVECSFLDPSAAAPAAAVGRLVVGALGDRESLFDVASGSEVVTYEWEGVPATAARMLHAAGHHVEPAAEALEVAQDRLSEKSTFRALEIAAPESAPAQSRDELLAALDGIGLPCVVKTRRGGYDGKGQVVVRDARAVEDAWSQLERSVPLIVEALVPFDRELSILGVRARSGETRCWPVVENVHEHGILRSSRAPAPGLDPELQRRAEALLVRLLDHFGYVGVLALELFHAGDDLLANEIAPRVHNSGHWTIEGSTTSQFENHLAALLDLPLGTTDVRGAAAMVNCIGTLPDPAKVLEVDGAHLHVYGKAPRPGRKLGHVTVTGRDAAEVTARLGLLGAPA